MEKETVEPPEDYYLPMSSCTRHDDTDHTDNMPSIPEDTYDVNLAFKTKPNRDTEQCKLDSYDICLQNPQEDLSYEQTDFSHVQRKVAQKQIKVTAVPSKLSCEVGLTFFLPCPCKRILYSNNM